MEVSILIGLYTFCPLILVSDRYPRCKFVICGRGDVFFTKSFEHQAYRLFVAYLITGNFDKRGPGPLSLEKFKRIGDGFICLSNV